MKTSDTIGKISTAFLKAQKKMGTVSKDSVNPFFKSKYADINAFLDVAIPALNEEGIVVLQPTGSDEKGHFVETLLIHESGEYFKSESLRLELNKSDMQQLGSAITYGRRYQLQAMCSMQADDDDGEKSMNRSAPVQQSKPAPKPTEVKPPVVAAPTLSGASKAGAATSSGAISAKPIEPAPAKPVVTKTSDEKELEILAKEGMPKQEVKPPVTANKPKFNKPSVKAPTNTGW